MIFVGLCVSNFASGPFIKNYAFIPPEIFIVTLYGAAVLYVIFVLKESLNMKILSQDQKARVEKLELKKILHQPKKLWRVLKETTR